MTNYSIDQLREALAAIRDAAQFVTDERGIERLNNALEGIYTALAGEGYYPERRTYIGNYVERN